MTASNVVDLHDRVVLITGASRGIGREAALRLGGAGARVAINHRDSAAQAEELARQLPGSAVVQGDVGKPEEAERLVEEVVRLFGRIDILVNNAAIFADNLFDGDDYGAWQEGWRRTFDVNVFGAANLAFLCMRHMRRQGGGKIINVSSRAAFRGETEFADYGASKAALVNLTRSIARACAKDRIIASCVAPGFTETEMAAELLATQGAEIVGQIPLGRVASVGDVAGVILFLASPWADYLTGVTIDVNGGSYFH